MSKYKNFEIRYCMTKRENVSIEVQRNTDGEVERRCLCGGKCEKCETFPYFPKSGPKN